MQLCLHRDNTAPQLQDQYNRSESSLQCRRTVVLLGLWGVRRAAEANYNRHRPAQCTTQTVARLGCCGCWHQYHSRNHVTRAMLLFERCSLLDASCDSCVAGCASKGLFNTQATLRVPSTSPHPNIGHAGEAMQGKVAETGARARTESWVRYASQ